MTGDTRPGDLTEATSRFSRVRHAPYGVLRPGDIIAVKQPGGPVVGAFQVGQVRSYQLTPGMMNKIRAHFGQQIHAREDKFWDDWAGSRYATLAGVMHPGPCRGSRSPSVIAVAGSSSPGPSGSRDSAPAHDH